MGPVPTRPVRVRRQQKEYDKELDQRDQDFLTTGNVQQHSKRSSAQQDWIFFKSFCFLYQSSVTTIRTAPSFFFKNFTNDQVSSLRTSPINLILDDTTRDLLTPTVQWSLDPMISPYPGGPLLSDADLQGV